MAQVNAGAWLKGVRRNQPLVHNMTNVVVTNQVANAVIAIGASPMMAYAREEIQDVAMIADALALNMGTITSDLIATMILAGNAAQKAGIPVVFDPVGVGATPYRVTAAAHVTSEVHLAALKGNVSEIGQMTGAGGAVNGVDAQSVGPHLKERMRHYARQHQGVVVATGSSDFVTDGETFWTLKNGHDWLSRITGSGCMLTGVIGAFLAIAKRDVGATYTDACVAAITCFNVAAEIAAESAHGPGTFLPQLFDALYWLDPDEVNRRAHIEWRDS